MSRRMVGDNQEVYRVVIVQKERRQNPDWIRGNITTGEPYYLYNGPEFEASYGPYNSLGAARAMVTRETLDYNKQPRPGVVSGRVEKATTTWETVT